MMKTHLIEETMPYNGEALSPHWIYKNVGILGNAVVYLSWGVRCEYLNEWST